LRSLDPSREDEERFRLLAEKTSDLVCLHEPDGRYLYISPSWRRLLGYEPEDLLGTDPYDLFHPEDLERIRSEARGDRIETESQPGEGPRMSFILPLLQERSNVR
jgi:PAS domain S-box-containing protein